MEQCNVVASKFAVRKSFLMDIDPLMIYENLWWYCCLKIFHGGEIKVDNETRYAGGEVHVVDMVELQAISLEVLEEMVIFVGGGKYKKGEKFIFSYKQRDADIRTGVRLLQTHADIAPMIADGMERQCLTIYVEIGQSRLAFLESHHDNATVGVQAYGHEEGPSSPEMRRTRISTISRHFVLPRKRLEFEKMMDCAKLTENLRRLGQESLWASNGKYTVVDVSSADEDDMGFDLNADIDNMSTEEDELRVLRTWVDEDIEWGGGGDPSKYCEETIDCSDDDEPLNFEDNVSMAGDSDDPEADDILPFKKRFTQQKTAYLPGRVFFIGQEFGTKQQLKEQILKHSIDTRRELKVVRNDRNRLRAVCKGKVAGESQVDENDPERFFLGCKESDASNMCPWVLHASIVSGSTTWQIKTLREDHSCLQSRKISACTFKFLAKGITDKIRSNPKIPVTALRAELESQYEVGISEMKAFRAKQEARKMLMGSYKEQYELLWDYAAELRRVMPDTSITVEVESPPHAGATTRVFKRLYCCLGPLKHGFIAGCRPILCLDGTFLKGPYPGQLLSAVGLDANNGIYPLAYAIVESENSRSWEWFLSCVGDDLGLHSSSNFCFMSDRQKGVVPAIAKLFPAAEHRFCLKHIWENFKGLHKGLAFKDHLWKAACATTVNNFDKAMTSLKALDEPAWKWLAAIPARHWSKSHFSEFCMSDLLYNNVCESFNSRIVQARDMPIISCLESIREYLVRRMTKVVLEIRKSRGNMCPNIQKQFDNVKKQAATLNCLWHGDSKYQVAAGFGDKMSVDLKKRSCTCRLWDLTGIPCKHAVRAIWSYGETGGEGDPDKWVDGVYSIDTWKKCYAAKIVPVVDRDQWLHIEGLTTILPPHHHTQPGRPKKARRRSKEETASQSSQAKRANRGNSESRVERKAEHQPWNIPRRGGTVTCQKCGNRGHNQRTCSGQVSKGPRRG